MTKHHKEHKGSKGAADQVDHADQADQADDLAGETTPVERPTADAAPGNTAALEPGNTALEEPAAPSTAPADTVDQQLAKLDSAGAPPMLLSLLATLHARQRSVEQHVQHARGEQVALRDQVIDLHRVVSSNADAIDQLAEMIAPVPAEPAAAAAPAAAMMAPPPPPERPAVPEHSGLGLGGIAGQRRDRGVRRFTPGEPISAPPIVAVVQLPPHNPRASAPPAALPAMTAPTRPEVTVLDEMHIDPRQLGPGDHELTTPGGRPVLVRVRQQGSSTGARRQGGGRTFVAKPAGNTEGS